MWTFPTIFILWYHTFFRLLLAENRDIKFLRFFAKMKNDREGGVRGGISYFSWTKEGTRVSHAKFQVSRSIPSYRWFLQKWGGRGGGLLSFCPKKPNLLSLVIKKLLLYKGKNWKIPTTQLSINTNYGELFDWTTGGHVVVRHFCAYSETHEQESRQTGNYIYRFDHN